MGHKTVDLYFVFGKMTEICIFRERVPGTVCFRKDHEIGTTKAFLWNKAQIWDVCQVSRSEWKYLERIFSGEAAPGGRLHKPPGPHSARREKSPVWGSSLERGGCPRPVGLPSRPCIREWRLQFTVVISFGIRNVKLVIKHVLCQKKCSSEKSTASAFPVFMCLDFCAQIGADEKYTCCLLFIFGVECYCIIHPCLIFSKTGGGGYWGRPGETYFIVITATKPVETRKTADTGTIT